MKDLKSLKTFEENGEAIQLNSKEMSNISGGVGSTRTTYGELTCTNNRDDRMITEEYDNHLEYSGWRPGLTYVSFKAKDITISAG